MIDQAKFGKEETVPGSTKSMSLCNSTDSMIEKNDSDDKDDDGLILSSSETDRPLSLFGLALLDFWDGRATEPLVYQRCCDQFAMQYDMYFYFTREFPPLEHRALQESVGSVLDVGAGTGRHAAELLGLGGVHAQERRNPAVTSVHCVELLPEACFIMEDRGLDHVYMADILDDEPPDPSSLPPFPFRGKLLKRGFPPPPTPDHRDQAEDGPLLPPPLLFDTILVLGDSIGMVGTLDRVKKLLARLRGWVRPASGKLLLDCSDIVQELARAAPAEHAVHVAQAQNQGRYVGESLMQYKYRNAESPPFWWCYVDWDTLVRLAHETGWTKVRRLQQDGIEYLAELRAH